MSSILSVSQLNKYVAFKLKSDIKLKGLCVKGEISNFSINYNSGHAYFTVKDELSSVKAVMFSTSVGRLKIKPEDGMLAIVTGNVELYEAGGVFQIIATDITPLGNGLLHAQTELVKEKLRKQGVFDGSNKKPIPLFPRRIAVISSMTGAALQDILNIISRRFPICSVDVYHTQVQGEGAAESIRDSLRLADKGGYDTLILARGGGSLEDLMPFNSEIAAVAVYECRTPIISAVGHETDTTLCDYAADLRAPTPSAAAELATPDKSELFAAVDKLRLSLDNSVNKRLEKYISLLDRISARLTLCSPQNRLDNSLRDVDAVSKRLDSLIYDYLRSKEHMLDKNAAALNALSPFGILSRGYSIVSKDKSIIRSADELDENDVITVRFSGSSVTAEISSITRKEENI